MVKIKVFFDRLILLIFFTYNCYKIILANMYSIYFEYQCFNKSFHETKILVVMKAW